VPTVEVDGVPLAYDDVGHGAVVVVLLHAGIADRRMWRHQVAALHERYRVLNVDLPGYGESGLPPEGYANHDAMVGLLTELGVGQAAVVGCSFGGAVAIDTALAYPGRVGALVLFGTAVSEHRWSAEFRQLQQSVFGDVGEDDLDAVSRAEVNLWVVGSERAPDDLDRDFLAFALELDRSALAAEAALDRVSVRTLAPTAVGRLGEIAVPTLVAVGAADVAEIRRLADRIAAEAPRARRLPDVPGAAHLLSLERPDVVNPSLLAFLP
jgi:3-oxoadipate enol-lactonase